jgi:DNA-3-methyladenine glycosylase II
MNSLEIKETILSSNPDLAYYLFQLPAIDKLQPKEISVLDAISRIVIGQMLSKNVAITIISRAEKLSCRLEKKGISFLSETELRQCGISSNKAKAIKMFSEKYLNEEERYENWKNLQPTGLFIEVEKHWGISSWSASMLAIFYFGFEDVYPIGDGSINRVTNKLEQKGIIIDSQKSAPFRSYLALYLWKILDHKII